MVKRVQNVLSDTPFLARNTYDHSPLAKTEKRVNIGIQKYANTA